jgi:hypothetical protein
MGQYVETPTKGLVASAAIGQFLRVKLNSTVTINGVAEPAYAVAGAADWNVEVGTVEEQSFASGELHAVRLRSAQGTRKMVAAAAISSGAALYAAAGGKVTSTAAGPQIGIALQAASGSGSIIECLYFPPAPMHFVDLTDVAALTPVQGDVPYIGAGGALAMLAPGTSGTKLTTEGAAANPIYS